ncbi:Cu2+-exporting ATPase [Sphingobium vermicomposti]|uniref:Cu2+-exporting ATPase n=2 Tax=Sphingobium vermicomposti TaxID=529005 RepID=A0A846M4F7_9SPHN|nr:Cu2+-exporting ATPase [Sphingobium vermicomposti]
MAKIERVLTGLEGVASARVNLSTRRVTVTWRRAGGVPPLLETLSGAGFEANLLSMLEDRPDNEKRRLILATAVSGFAAMNIMLLSVSVWSGADAGTRQLFHLISALLALPTVVYSGRIFFQSAWSALRAGHTNMDVPISIGIVLALALSLFDTLHSGPHAYFDAVVTLIFFLLIGRTLDHLMRDKARSAVLGLTRMMPAGAKVLVPDGSRAFLPLDQIAVGDVILLAPGERVPLDGIVLAGEGDVDTAAVTGEAMPVPVTSGSRLLSGMLNLDGSLEIRVTNISARSFLSEMVRMMEAAEQGRARYRRLADRAAAYYSPIIHSLAFAAFAGWFLASGDWHRSLTIAISVLIITCPCALGLAIPMVQMVAAKRLFERGIALKDGSALERLADIDIVVFDKTGTLTIGDLRVTESEIDRRYQKVALEMASRSEHPVARAIAASGEHPSNIVLEGFSELPGKGLEASSEGRKFRLGRADWALAARDAAKNRFSTVLSVDGELAGHFAFSDLEKTSARETVRQINDLGLPLELLSGDRPEAVSALAASIGISQFRAGLLPQQKVQRLEVLAARQGKAMMVGDGLNDGPALAAAHVSMAPSNAADIGRAAADVVFFGQDLTTIPQAIRVARKTRSLVRQNLALSVGYNLLVIPIALAGHVSPLLAAVAMSLSSISVVANSLRIPRPAKPRFDPSDRGRAPIPAGAAA